MKKILHGAGQSPEQFKKYWDAVESFKPSIYMIYLRINEIREKFQNKADDAEKISPKLMLQIGLNLKAKEIGNQCKQIIEGKHDKEIVYLIKSLKDYKNKCFLRIGYEFNNPGHNYNPKEFIEAWKYILNKFRKQKVSNVEFVWDCCTAFNKKVEEIMEYYPGDEYVDWFGNNLFGVQWFRDNQSKITENFALEAEKHNKPLMICESSAARVGVEEGEESWNNWFKPFFKWIKTHKACQAFCYINWNWGIDWKKPEWGNCRIEENEVVRKRYVKELGNKRYAHLN